MTRGKLFAILFILVLLNYLLTLSVNILLQLTTDTFSGFIADNNIFIVFLTFFTVPISLIGMVGLWLIKRWGIIIFVVAWLLSVLLEIYFNLTIENYYSVYTTGKVVQMLYFNITQIALVYLVYKKLKIFGKI